MSGVIYFVQRTFFGSKTCTKSHILSVSFFVNRTMCLLVEEKKVEMCVKKQENRINKQFFFFQRVFKY